MVSHAFRLFSILVGVMGLGLSTTLCFAQGRVSNVESRQRTLEVVTAVVEASPHSYEPMPGGRENPFAEVKREEPAATIPVQSGPGQPVRVEAKPPESVRLPDPVALTAIARNFRPSGSIIVGNRRLLRLVDGTMLEQGNSFTARIGREAYVVKVISVTPDGYTIGLGEARHSARFLETPVNPTPSPAAETPDETVEGGE